VNLITKVSYDIVVEGDIPVRYNPSSLIHEGRAVLSSHVA